MADLILPLPVEGFVAEEHRYLKVKDNHLVLRADLDDPDLPDWLSIFFGFRPGRLKLVQIGFEIDAWLKAAKAVQENTEEPIFEAFAIVDKPMAGEVFEILKITDHSESIHDRAVLAALPEWKKLAASLDEGYRKGDLLGHAIRILYAIRSHECQHDARGLTQISLPTVTAILRTHNVSKSFISLDRLKKSRSEMSHSAHLWAAYCDLTSELASCRTPPKPTSRDILFNRDHLKTLFRRALSYRAFLLTETFPRKNKNVKFFFEEELPDLAISDRGLLLEPENLQALSLQDGHLQFLGKTEIEIDKFFRDGAF